MFANGYWLFGILAYIKYDVKITVLNIVQILEATVYIVSEQAVNQQVVNYCNCQELLSKKF